MTHDRYGVGRVVRAVDDWELVVDFGLPDGTLRQVSPLKLTKL